MQPLGTKVYLLKMYSPSDSFCTFFSESVAILVHENVLLMGILESHKLPDEAVKPVFLCFPT